MYLELGALYQAQHEAAQAEDWAAFDLLAIKIGALHAEAARTEEEVPCTPC